MQKTTTRSNRLIKIILLLVLFGFSRQQINAQTAPVKQWDKTFGGSDTDQLTSLQQTSDGGYILGGYSNSGISGDKSQASKGDLDYWVVKLDASGNKLWDKTFGGSGVETFSSLQQTSDGGYILGGDSHSGISGDKSQARQGNGDYWVVKLDASGNKLWDKSFGGSDNEDLWSLQQTSDGGYILGGVSYSGISGDKSQPSRGVVTDDYWVVKLDASGNKTWDKTFGGTWDSDDQLRSLKQTSDGGYILGGYTRSGDGGDKTQDSKGGQDYWVIKLDASGNKTWDKTIGGSSSGDQLNSLQQTSDGGYILGGSSGSPISGDKTQASKGGLDYWIVKLDVNGNKTWDKTLGGSDSDHFLSLQQTSDGGYILGGFSQSGISGDKSQASQGPLDYWVVKVDASGNKIWDKTLGGSDLDIFQSLQQTSDGGYILGGYSPSGISGDKSQASQGGQDYWVVKLAGENPLPVSWLYFNGKNTESGSELNWATATEKNSANFVVERSENGKNFEVIGAVNAAGNSNQQLVYSFTDKNPLAAKTYYRLKQDDLDGTFDYSKIITVNKGKYGVLEASAYPNPFNEVLHLQTSAPEKIRQVVLLSIDGKELYSKNINKTADLILTDLPVLKSGLYLLRLSGDNSITKLKINRQ